MYTSFSGSAAAAGYSSGTAIKIQVAAEKLPRGYDIDWAGISADEVSQGNQAIWVFLVWVCLFGFSSTIRKFYSALIRNSIITRVYLVLSFAVDRFRK
jgi:multidrug efflux pump subunit AcrB